ncbi:hypothetical protein BGZ83_002689, partial [Gryganskiella cystojenkinii]
ILYADARAITIDRTDIFIPSPAFAAAAVTEDEKFKSPLERRYGFPSHSPFLNPSHQAADALSENNPDDNGNGPHKGGDRKLKKRDIRSFFVSTPSSSASGQGHDVDEEHSRTGQVADSLPHLPSDKLSSTWPRRHGVLNRLSYDAYDVEQEGEAEDENQNGISYYYDDDRDDYEPETKAKDTQGDIDPEIDFDQDEQEEDNEHPVHGMALIEPGLLSYRNKLFSLGSSDVDDESNKNGNDLSGIGVAERNGKEHEYEEDEDQDDYYAESMMNGIPDEDGRYPDFDSGSDDEEDENFTGPGYLKDWYDNDDDRPRNLYKPRRNAAMIDQQDMQTLFKFPTTNDVPGPGAGVFSWPTWVLDEWDESLDGTGEDLETYIYNGYEDSMMEELS